MIFNLYFQHFPTTFKGFIDFSTNLPEYISEN